jgi:voltage-gated potassium channel
VPRASRDEAEYDSWLEEVTERADPFMAWLGVLFALLLGYELVVDLQPSTSRALLITGWGIWFVFAMEFAAKLWLAPRKGRFLRRHWVQAAGLALPALRVLRLVRLLRLGRAFPAARVLSSSYRTVGSARRLLGSRLGYLGATAAVLTIAAAQLAYLFERDAERGIFDGFGDALLWAFAVVVGLQGSPVPTTLGAHLVMLGGFVVGLVLIASLAGTLGAFLVGDRTLGDARAPTSGPMPPDGH